MTFAVIVVVIVVVVLVVVFLARRRSSDPVDSFRRQIDALSPEARRPTIRQGDGAGDEPIEEASDDSSGADGAGEDGDPDGT